MFFFTGIEIFYRYLVQSTLFLNFFIIQLSHTIVMSEVSNITSACVVTIDYEMLQPNTPGHYASLLCFTALLLT